MTMAKSFDDSEGHSRDLMRFARRPKALPRCHIHAFIPAHLRSQNLFNRIHGSAFMPPCSRRTYAAAFSPHLCSSIDAATLKLPRPHSTYSAAFTPPHAFAALTPPDLCCSSHAAAYLPPPARRRLHGATSMQPSHAPAFTPTHATELVLDRPGFFWPSYHLVIQLQQSRS